MAFISALRSDNLLQARQLLGQLADVNYQEPPPSLKTPLFHALECGGKTASVHLLLKARANVNQVAAGGTTPLHYAIAEYTTLPPLVIRMLLSHKADLTTPDERGMSPLDWICSLQSAQPALQGNTEDASDSSVRMKQLLNEVTEMPTLDIVEIEGQQVLGAIFANTENDKIVFSTDSSIGLYSVQQKRVRFLKKLRKRQVDSSVKHVSVNPVYGTIAVCLDLPDMRQHEVVRRTNAFIVWPNGELQDEEPLKLSIKVDSTPHESMLPACVMLSRCEGSQMLLGRLVDGKVFSWDLDPARSQLVGESQLTKHGGLCALSDNGAWIAVVTTEPEHGGTPQLTIYSYESPEGRRQKPEVVLRIPRNPQAMALQETAEGCYVALSEAPFANGVATPIDVMAISLEADHWTYRTIYQLNGPSPCYSLTFSHQTPGYLLSGQADGLIVLYSLLTGSMSMCQDSPGRGNHSISSDRSLIVSTEECCFRVFKVPPPDQASWGIDWTRSPAL